MFTVTLRKLYSTKILVKTAVVPRKFYNYIIYQGNSNNLGEFFWIHFNLRQHVPKSGAESGVSGLRKLLGALARELGVLHLAHWS